jgi:hypothetical protein
MKPAPRDNIPVLQILLLLKSNFQNSVATSNVHHPKQISNSAATCTDEAALTIQLLPIAYKGENYKGQDEFKMAAPSRTYVASI